MAPGSTAKSCWPAACWEPRGRQMHALVCLLRTLSGETHLLNCSADPCGCAFSFPVPCPKPFCSHVAFASLCNCGDWRGSLDRSHRSHDSVAKCQWENRRPQVSSAANAETDVTRPIHQKQTSASQHGCQAPPWAGAWRSRSPGFAVRQPGCRPHTPPRARLCPCFPFPFKLSLTRLSDLPCAEGFLQRKRGLSQRLSTCTRAARLCTRVAECTASSAHADRGFPLGRALPAPGRQCPCSGTDPEAEGSPRALGAEASLCCCGHAAPGGSS